MATSDIPPFDNLVSIALVRHFLDLASRQGYSTKDLLAEADLEPTRLADDDGWLPVTQSAAMMHAVLRVSGDPLIALKLSQLSFVSGFGIVGYLLESSLTLKDAILSVMRYERLLSTAGISRLDYLPGEVSWSIVCHTADPVVDRQMEEFLIGVRYLFTRMVKAKLSNIVSTVRFRHPAPADPEQLAVYHAIFDCPVQFDQAHSALVLKLPALAFELHQMAPGLKQTLEGYADRKLAMMMGAASGSPLAQARAQLSALLYRGHASREHLAECLGVSGRHLARQLTAEGSSYGQLLDDLRQEVAHKLLTDSTRTISEIGQRLSFSDGPSFSRWFRQRTGETPRDYRQRLGG